MSPISEKGNSLPSTIPVLRRRRGAAFGALLAVLGTLGTAVPSQASATPPADCPPVLVGKATCYTGQDANGAYYTTAIPKL